MDGTTLDLTFHERITVKLALEITMFTIEEDIKFLKENDRKPASIKSLEERLETLYSLYDRVK